MRAHVLLATDQFRLVRGVVQGEPAPRGEGCAIILDNASCHRKEALRKLARGKARILFLPPYSPDCNPIEKSWANMKRCLRDGNHDFCMADYAIYEYFALRNLA